MSQCPVPRQPRFSTLGCLMDDKESLLKKIGDGIKDAAKAVEDFADEVAAPQAPVILISDDDEPTPEPSIGGKRSG